MAGFLEFQRLQRKVLPMIFAIVVIPILIASALVAAWIVSNLEGRLGQWMGDAARAADANLDDWLAGVERQSILEALAKSGGVQAHAAKFLGVSERSL